MIQVRKSEARGKTQMGWLHSLHTFSFGEYYDPHFVNVGPLRVINEDRVKPGMGFGYHPHRDMEIISYVIEGQLAHKDSMGNGSIIKPGEIQIMSAGTGIEHSEFNHSQSQGLHFLQIWIIPHKSGLQPRYQQETIQQSDNAFILIGAQEASAGVVTIHQDVKLYVAFMLANHKLHYNFGAHRIGWLQLIKGNILVNGEPLAAGDGAAIDGASVTIDCTQPAEFLFFDLAAA